MEALWVVDGLLEEVAAAILVPLDCHRELVYNRVKEAGNQDSLPVGCLGGPVDWHDRHGIPDDDGRKYDGIE